MALNHQLKSTAIPIEDAASAGQGEQSRYGPEQPKGAKSAQNVQRTLAAAAEQPLLWPQFSQRDGF